MRVRGLVFFLILAVASALHLRHQTINPLHEAALEQSHEFLPLLLPFLFESAVAAEGAAAIGGAVTAAETIGGAVTAAQAIGGTTTAVEAIGGAVTAGEGIGGAVTLGEGIGGAVTAGEAIGGTVTAGQASTAAAVGEAAGGKVTADEIAKDLTEGQTIATALAGAATGAGELLNNAIANSGQLGTQKALQEMKNVAVHQGFSHFFLQTATPQLQLSIQKINSQQTVTSKECSEVVGKCFARINQLQMYQSHEECMKLDSWCSSKIAV